MQHELSLRKLFDWEPRSVAPSKALSHHFGNASTQRIEKPEKRKSKEDTEKRAGERWKRLMRTNGGGKKESM